MGRVEALQSLVFEGCPVRHGFLTRRGGVSDGPFRSLNCGFGSNDVRARVSENRRRAVAAAGLGNAPLVTPYQVHGTRVIVAGPEPLPAQRADAVVTAQPGVAVGILTADCAPVLFADPVAGVAGAAHAGWKGALAGVLPATIDRLERLGAKRERVVAAIGPAIAQASYEVDPPFAEPFLRDDPDGESLFRRAGAKLLFDLPGYTVRCLERAGIGTVDVLDRDTAGEPDSFFSYRRNFRAGEPRYGRLLSLIGIAA